MKNKKRNGRIFRSESTRIIKADFESNPAYSIVEMFICDTRSNLNNQGVTENFILSTKDELIGMPIQVDRKALENGRVNQLTHRLSETDDDDEDDFKTDSVGSFIATTTEEVEIDGEKVLVLYGTAKIYKRYKKVHAEIEKLYNQDNLKFSYEILASSAKRVANVDYADEGYWIGHCIVSFPAYPQATALKMIAELTPNTSAKAMRRIRDEIEDGLDYKGFVVDVTDNNKAIIHIYGDDKRYITDIYKDEDDKAYIDLKEMVEVQYIAVPKEEVKEEDIIVGEKANKEKQDVKQKADIDDVVKETKKDDSDIVLRYANQISRLTDELQQAQEKIKEVDELKKENEKLVAELDEIKAEKEKEEMKEFANEKLKKFNVSELTKEMKDAIEKRDMSELKLVISEYVISNVDKIENKEKDEDVVEKPKDKVVTSEFKADDDDEIELF